MKAVQQFFPTSVYYTALSGRNGEMLVKELLKESYKIRGLDHAGQKWSNKNYLGGYTSYGSWSNLNERSSTFRALQDRLDGHVKSFASYLQFDQKAAPLVMTNCWINIVPAGTYHGLHIHPISAISGTIYLKTPRGAGALKFQDPRLSRMMAAPPKQDALKLHNQNFFSLKPRVGHVVLFESWLDHEVLKTETSGDRVSVSFNYSWF